MLVQRVHELLGNQELYKELYSKAREIAVEEFAPDVYIGKLNKIYSDAAG